MAAPLIRTSWCRTRLIYASISQTLRRNIQKTSVCMCKKDSFKQNIQNPPKAETTQDKGFNHIVDFFNNADLLALRKLVALDQSLFQNLDPIEIMSRGGDGAERFKSFEDVKNAIQFVQEDTNLLEMLVGQVATGAVTNSLIFQADPRIQEKTVEKMERIVAVDVLMGDVAWVEQEVHSRTVVSLGHERVFDKPMIRHIRSMIDFDHVTYQNKMFDIVKKIPESGVYYTSSNLKQIQDKYLLRYHQVLVEAFLITMLNARHNLRANYTAALFPNKVYLINQPKFCSYYNVRYNSEMYKNTWMVDAVLDNKPGPLSGMKIKSSEDKERLRSEVGKGLLTKTILLSDMMCSILRSFKNSETQGSR